MADSMNPWQGRDDREDGDAGRRWHQVVQPTASTAPGIALLGLASDLGVRRNKGRPGAIEGPAALRQALANFAWHHDRPLHDAGDILVDDDLEAGQDAYAEQVAALLAAGHFVIGLGGGHEIAWGSFQGCRRFLDRDSADLSLGILNFDAHFDLRQPAPQSSSGTPFYQVATHCEERGQAFHYCCLGVAPTANTPALYQRADTLGVSYQADLDCRGEQALPLLERFLAKVDCLYVTVCLDVFPAAYAPGVSAPAALGVNPAWLLHTLASVGELARQLNVHWLMTDIAELSPPHDPDGRTARLGARVIDSCLAAKFAER